VNYTYDAASNRKTMRDAESGTTTYSYDTLNRVQNILDFNNDGFGFSYDQLNRKTSLTRPNGVTTTDTYDSLSRLLSVLHQAGGVTIDGASYGLDAAGNRTSKTDLRANVASNYGYDKIYQLTQVIQGAATTENYTYDPVGNRLTDFSGQTYSYNNSSNHLDSAGSTTYTYDANGNTQTKVAASGTTQYTWDQENRLKQVTPPGTAGTATFTYDPFGRRVQKAFTVNSVTTTTNYLYDGANIIEELDQNGNSVARYTYDQAIDEPLAMVRNAVISFFERDGLGSNTSLTNSSGEITDTYTFDSFGNSIASAGTTTNPFRYTGREYDAETGLYYVRARYYDSSTGRFMSEDPIRFDGGIDFYTYVSNNPTNFNDPLGLQSPYENITHNASKMGPIPKFCDKDKNCRMFISCGETSRTEGFFHCTVTIQNGSDYTAFDGGPAGGGLFGGIFLGQLKVASGRVKYGPRNPPPGPNSFVGAVPCDCAEKEAKAINAADMGYNFGLQNSNSAAAMIAAACGVSHVNWPSRAWGYFNNTPQSNR
jgi:RHS repeat-associated protein